MMSTSQDAISVSQKKYIERIDKFRWNRDVGKKLITNHGEYFERLDGFEKLLLEDCNSGSNEELYRKANADDLTFAADELFLKNLLTKICEFTFKENLVTYMEFIKVFSLNSPPTATIFDTMHLFMILCTFLHTNTRITPKPKSYSAFVADYDPTGYNKQSSMHYSKQEMQSDADRLRKSRYRKLRQGRVFVPVSKWAAVPENLEHELKFHFKVEKEGGSVFDTYKKFGNLYNDLSKAIDDVASDSYTENLLKAEKRFLAKVKQIDYSNYLKLQQKIRDHLNSDLTYQGINLYRWERTMMPWRIVHDVNRLLSGELNFLSEDDYLLRASYLKEVPFPQLYESLLLSTKVSIRKIREYAIAFDRLTREMNRDGCLILDALIEKKILGENWQRTMCSLMNKLGKKVLYDPKEIDLTVPEGDAQRKFEKLLSYPVKISLYNETENLEFLLVD